VRRVIFSGGPVWTSANKRSTSRYAFAVDGRISPLSTRVRTYLFAVRAVTAHPLPVDGPRTVPIGGVTEVISAKNRQAAAGTRVSAGRLWT
jgi:hypothetical protein